MKIVYIYGGQGSQVEGMGQDLYAEYPFIRDYYKSLEADFPLKKLSFQGDLKTFSQTEYTQSLMLVFQISITKVLASYGIKPDIVLGLSLGEYSALYASGVLNEDELLKVIEYRSREMAQVSKRLDSKMLAVFSDDLIGIKNICKSYSNKTDFVQVSNINTKGQIVISGDKDLVNKVNKHLKNDGFKVKELNTSGPFHTSYMGDVSVKLKEFFNNMEFRTPKIPIIYNLKGDFDSDGDIKDIMAKQVSNPVLFKNCLERLLAQDVDLIIEIGHKNTIKGLVKRMAKDERVLSINNVESIKKLVKEVALDEKEKGGTNYWGIKRYRKGYSH